MEDDPIEMLKNKMAALETQVAERDAKLNMIEHKQKTADIGSQRFGMSDWKPWVSGSEKGYHRSCYVDINSMYTPRAF